MCFLEISVLFSEVVRIGVSVFGRSFVRVLAFLFMITYRFGNFGSRMMVTIV